MLLLKSIMADIGKVLSGAEFNQKYAGIPMYRFTNTSETHNDFQYGTGLNVDFRPFNPSGECTAGGLYFADVFNSDWAREQTWVRPVTIPKDAWVYIEEKKFKADKFILGERSSIMEFNIPQEFALAAGQQ